MIDGDQMKISWLFSVVAVGGFLMMIMLKDIWVMKEVSFWSRFIARIGRPLNKKFANLPIFFGDWWNSGQQKPGFRSHGVLNVKMLCQICLLNAGSECNYQSWVFKNYLLLSWKADCLIRILFVINKWRLCWRGFPMFFLTNLQQVARIRNVPKKARITSSCCQICKLITIMLMVLNLCNLSIALESRLGTRFKVNLLFLCHLKVVIFWEDFLVFKCQSVIIAMNLSKFLSIKENFYRNLVWLT